MKPPQADDPPLAELIDQVEEAKEALHRIQRALEKIEQTKNSGKGFPPEK
jgi:hypothetical protein